MTTCWNDRLYKDRLSNGAGRFSESLVNDCVTSSSR